MPRRVSMAPNGDDVLVDLVLVLSGRSGGNGLKELLGGRLDSGEVPRESAVTTL
jgi:hypothetical protein